MGMQPVPASAVIVLQAHRDRPAILLLKRHPDLALHGGVWVFPGGRVEPQDGPPDGSLGPARACAVRETWEEAGLRFAPGDLVPVSRWVTPDGLPKRFDTWFFIATADQHARVQIDGREIVDHRWLTAAQALSAHQSGACRLSPPGFVLLSQLAGLDSSALLKQVSKGPPPHYTPRLIPLADGACTVYQDDAAYISGDLDCAGPRHRLWMHASGWQYEQTG